MLTTTAAVKYQDVALPARHAGTNDTGGNDRDISDENRQTSARAGRGSAKPALTDFVTLMATPANGRKPRRTSAVTGRLSDDLTCQIGKGLAIRAG